MENREMTNKHCNKCSNTKPNSEFYRDASRKDGLKAWCKACKAASQKQWYAVNREKQLESSRKWREANPERHAENGRRWREANPERHAELCRKWNAANPERAKAYDAKRAARDIKRGHRYNRAFKYFEGRQGWTDLIAASCLREKRLHVMEWTIPSLSDHLAVWIEANEENV